MGLKFKDFAPELIEAPVLGGRKYESLDDALDVMNLWIAESKVRVVNVETVTLPAVRERDTGAVEVRANSLRWHQFFRVWYHD